MENHFWQCDAGRGDEVRVWFYDRLCALLAAWAVARVVGQMAGFEAPLVVVLGALALVSLHHKGGAK